MKIKALSILRMSTQCKNLVSINDRQQKEEKLNKFLKIRYLCKSVASKKINTETSKKNNKNGVSTKES